MRPSLHHWPVAVIAVLALTIWLVGNELAEAERTAHTSQAETRLVAIATLKARQFAEWRHERIADAQTLSDNPFLVDRVAEFLDRPRPDDARTKTLSDYLQALKENYRYDDVLILDNAGNIRLSLNQQQASLRPALGALLAASRISGRAELSDFHPAAHGADFHISAIAPLASGSEPARRERGFIVLQSSLENTLLPLLSPPHPLGQGVRSYLIRREDEQLRLLGQPGQASTEPLMRKVNLRESGLQDLLTPSSGLSQILPSSALSHRPILAAAAISHGSEWQILSLDETALPIPASRVEQLTQKASAALLLAFGLCLLVDLRTRRQNDSAHPLQQPPPAPPSPPPFPTPPPPQMPAEDATPPSISPVAAPPPPPPSTSPPPEHGGLARLASTPGFDVRAGLRVVAGRESRYLELLNKYLEHHRELANQIADAILDGDHAQAQKLSHTLKGAAGTLGLQASQAAARELEHCLRDANTELIPPCLAELTRIHNEQCAQLERLSPRQPPCDSTAATDIGKAMNPAALEDLRRLLAEDDIRSNELARQQRTSLVNLLGSRHEEFCHALDRFDYPAALALLSTDKKTMPITGR